MEEDNIFDFGTDNDEEFENSADVDYEGTDDLWMIDDDQIVTTEIDTDGDGIVDTIVTGVDFDGDGIIDMATYETDTNYDGMADISYTEVDLDGDGVADLFTVQQDIDGDGIVDVTYSEVDLDGDGIGDAAMYEEDLNSDGIMDNTEVEIKAGDSGKSLFMRAQDIDFDGNKDTFSVDMEDSKYFRAGDLPEDAPESDEPEYTYDIDDIDDADDTDDIDTDDDTDNYTDDVPAGDEDDFFSDVEDTDYSDDSNPENYDETDDEGYYDEEADLIVLPTVDYDTNNDNGLDYTELENFDPGQDDSEGVIGNPEEAMELWEPQGDTNRCAIYSQKFVIEEYTGEEVDIEELADIAEANGWFTESGGTPVIYMDKLLDYYGVPNEVNQSGSMEDLVESLNDGNRVIVAIDADEIWYGENDYDSVYTPGDGVNHAVEVIGINNSDPENPTVILNDSGNPNGCGVEIPMETFMDAWEDGNNYMIECM